MLYASQNKSLITDDVSLSMNIYNITTMFNIIPYFGDVSIFSFKVKIYVRQQYNVDLLQKLAHLIIGVKEKYASR